MKVNLENIREYFPKLKRFIARLRKEDIDLISEKNKTDVDTNKVLEGFGRVWQIVTFGENINKFDIEISIESLEEMVEWLGCQTIKDTDILMMRMNMIDDLGVMDKALDTLYRVLADVLEEE